VTNNECPICRHIERNLIDHAIAEGRPDSYVTCHFAADADSVRWHRENCLGAAGSAATATAAGCHEVAPAAELEQLRELRATAHRIATEAATSEKHWRTSLAAMSTVSRLLAQETKLRDRKRPVAPSLAESAEWQQLKTRILIVLERFPEAREALVEALQHDRT
jgi:hypothetical protein